MFSMFSRSLSKVSFAKVETFNAFDVDLIASLIVSTLYTRFIASNVIVAEVIEAIYASLDIIVIAVIIYMIINASLFS